MSNISNKKDFQIIKEGITYPKGIKAAGIKSGIRFNRKDLALIYSEKIANGCGMFTTNKFKAAPLIVTEKNLYLSKGKLQAILINSGVANACTGEKGLQDAWETVSYVSDGLKIHKEYIAVTSTGKIGEFLPLDKIKTGVKEAITELSIKGGTEAAEAILTTDIKKKEIAVSFELDGQEVRIGAMAKGSGMIHPNMATMLGFIASDISTYSYVNIMSQYRPQGEAYQDSGINRCPTGEEYLQVIQLARKLGLSRGFQHKHLNRL